MKFETIGNATIYLADCREILPSIKNQIDAVIADVPYGINFVHGGGGTSGVRHNVKPIHGDDAPFNPLHLLELVGARVKSNKGTTDKQLILFGADNYSQHLPPGGQWLVWDKACGQLNYVGG